jgi:hypothetical protein
MTFSNEIDPLELNKMEKQLVGNSIKIKEHLENNGIKYERDIRYTTFTTLSSIIRSLELYFILRGNYLLDNQWWIQIEKLNIFPISEISFEEDVKEIRKDFDAYMNIGLYSFSFSFIESRLRVFYNYVLHDGNKKDQISSENISFIFNKLFEKIGFSDKEYYAFELFRTIRNTLHNNGVFTKPKGREKVKPIETEHNNCKYDEVGMRITYDSIPFYLQYNKSQDFGNSMNLLIQKILPDIITIICKIISHLKSVNSEITDPLFEFQ